PRVYDDETRLDMTPLIDVCMVLLIFFILTTSYTVLQKIIEAANLRPSRVGGGRPVSSAEVESTMVRVALRDIGGDKVRVQIEKETFDADKDVYDGDKADEARQLDRRLVDALQQFRGGGDKNKVLLEFDRGVPHGFTVAVQDAAKLAGMSEVLVLIP